MSRESTKDLATIIRTPVAMRLAYLGCWIFGLLALIGGVPGVINKFQLPAGWDLGDFTEPVPLAFVWSVLVFLLYLFRGDNSAHHKKYLVPFQGIWATVTLVTLVATLNSYLAYHTVQVRLLAATANKTLASMNIRKLEELTNTLRNPAGESYSDYHRSVTYTHRLAQAALDQMNRAIDYESHDLAEPSQSPPGRDVLTDTVETELWSLLQIREILTATIRSLDHISASLVIEPTDPQAGTIKSVSGQIDDVSWMVSLAGNSLEGLQFKDSAIFLWLSGLNTTFILFPWTLLLLFIYRKRNNRAKQIYDDLLRLAPDRELLNRVLNTELPLTPDQRQPSRPISSPDGPETRKDRDQWIIKQLANQTFSNFEYVLNLLFFSLLIDVGWYFIFYPEANLDLTKLVRQGDGIKELTNVIVRSFTPLTMGFAGAYFYAIQMLVRRYLTNDLY